METLGLSHGDGEAGDTPDVLRRLEVYAELNEQHGRYASLLDNALSQRRSVRETIFQKVRQEYEDRKSMLERERDQLGDLLRANLETFVREREQLESASREEEDRLEEIDFRVQVGEHTAEAVAEERGVLSRSLERHTEKRGRLEEILNAYERVGLSGVCDESPDSSDSDPDPDGSDRSSSRADRETPLPEAPGGKVPEREPQHASPAAPPRIEPSAGPCREAVAAFQVLGQSTDPLDDTCPVVHCLDIPAGKGFDERVGYGDDPRGGSRGHGSHGCVTGYLVAVAGSRRGERFPLLCSNITLGTSPGSDIRLADPGIRNFHAQIHFKGRKHYLENLDSMGCSFVNGLQGGLMELKDGDIIRLGEVKFQVEFSDVN